MALSEQSRSTIYDFLVPNIGEEAASEMLSNFPSDDHSPPASEELVRSEFAAVRAALAGHDGRITSIEERMDTLDGRMTSMETSMASMEASMTSMDHRMVEGFAALRIEMHDGFRQQLMSMLTTFVAMMAVLVAAVAVFS
jgi:hypothetical protein